MKAFPDGSLTGWRNVALFCWLVVGSFAWSQGARAAAPANDNFADRIVITEANIPVTGSTLESTEEAGEPQGSTKTVWYSWEAVEGEPFAFVMEHSTFVETARIYSAYYPSNRVLDHKMPLPRLVEGRNRRNAVFKQVKMKHQRCSEHSRTNNLLAGSRSPDLILISYYVAVSATTTRAKYSWPEMNQ